MNRTLLVVDLSDPDNPYETTSKDTSRLHFNKNGNLMSAINSNGFEVLRLTDPIHPETVFKASASYIEKGAVSEDVVVVGVPVHGNLSAQSAGSH